LTRNGGEFSIPLPLRLRRIFGAAGTGAFVGGAVVADAVAVVAGLTATAGLGLAACVAGVLLQPASTAAAANVRPAAAVVLAL
jgi:hypothetical protein